MNDDFAAFVHSTGTQLYRTALLLTGDHHLAEDLTQATYAKAFASWRRVSTADNPVAYVRTTLFNTFLSHKRLRRNGELPSETMPERPVAPAGPELRLDLIQALGLLAPADRAVLVARYWEDRSVAETADILGISDSLVRTRARRALQRIRPLLADAITEGISR
jgi:RNA polymerase sigma-70 factor (sigma-E family)